MRLESVNMMTTKNRIVTLFLLCAALLTLALPGMAEDLAPLTEAMFEGPILLTSVGQSADVNIVDTLLKKAGIEVRMSVSAVAADVEGYKTLVLAVGGSSKGLGAAGIDEKQELARVTAMIEAAKAQDVKILALHIGGQARRGVLSDMFLPDAFSAADAAIVVESGDLYEGLAISDLLREAKIPAAYVQSQIDVVAPLKLVFGQ